MSTTYKALAGDTFESIARKVFGDHNQAGALIRANPGIVEPITAGATVFVPDLPGAPTNTVQRSASGSLNETAVYIDGQRFRHWTGITIGRSLDNISTVSFIGPFEESEPVFRDRFKPLKFRPLEVTIGGRRVFTGTMINPYSQAEPEQVVLSVNGYGKPGILNDCTLPVSAYPELENFDLTLAEIAKIVSGPFGISTSIDTDPGPTFEDVAAEEEQKVMSYLIKLAKQRNLVITDTVDGKLLFTRSIITGKPVASLAQGEPGIISVDPLFSPQEYYSEITGIVPVLAGIEGPSYTVKNKHLQDVFRPLTMMFDDATDADLKTAVDNRVGRMFANAISYRVRVPSWRDPKGELWKPNTFFQLTAPGAMIYNPYKFIIRNVDLVRTSDEETAELLLTVPGSFSGGVPEALPWD